MVLYARDCSCTMFMYIIHTLIFTHSCSGFTVHVQSCLQLLVYTASPVHSELEAVGEVSGGVGVTTSEAVIGDIYTQFTTAVDVFSSSGEVHVYNCPHCSMCNSNCVYPDTLLSLPPCRTCSV